MNAFLVLAHLVTPAAALLAPALLAARPGWKVAAIGHGAALAVLFLAGLIAGASFTSILFSALFATAFALLAVGVHLAAGQVASGLVVVLLVGSLAVGEPWVRQSIDRGDDASGRLEVLLALSPFAVQDASILGRDVLREPVIYNSTHFADYIPTVGYPRWGAVAAGYALVGAALGALGVWRRRRA